jgi:hypothetical protein
MSTTTKATDSWQEPLYIALAIAGLVGTWAQVFGYFDAGIIGGNVQFWQETFATPASTFIVVDIFVLAAAVFVLMFAEGRRLGIGSGWLWTYYLGSVLVGISCFVPLFLAHRQRVLRTQRQTENVAPRGTDLIAVGLAVLMAVVLVGYSLMHIPG